MEQLAAWGGRYIVHADSIFWNRDILTMQFRYVSPADSTYWQSQILWDRTTLSVLDRFVQYHFQCCYYFAETARDGLLVRIPPLYDRLSLFQEFLLDQEHFYAPVQYVSG